MNAARILLCFVWAAVVASTAAFAQDQNTTELNKVVSSAAGGPSGGISYVVTNLGTLGGKNSRAIAINDAGQIVGAAEAANGAFHAFLYTDGKMQDLGAPFGGPASEATAMNDAGQVVGYADTAKQGLPPPGGGPASKLAAPGPYITHAFLYSDGKVQDLGTLGGSASSAIAINHFGKIVGEAETSDASEPGMGPVHLFFYTDGKMEDLSANSLAAGINNAGQVAGSMANGNNEQAFIYSNGIRQIIAATDDQISTEATAINSSGAVVGVADLADTGPRGLGFQFDGARHAFLYSGGKMKDLGTLGGKNSWASAINDAGMVIGWSDTDNDSRHPMLCNDGKMEDLAALVGDAALASAGFKSLIAVQGINNHGQIVGVGKDVNGCEVACLLSPIPGPTASSSVASAVPAAPPPSAATYVISSLGTLGGRNSRANAINTSGQIVGQADTASGNAHAFLYSAGKMQDIEAVAGNISVANAINAAGQIVGETRPAQSGWQQAFLYTGGRMQCLGAVGGDGGEASSINDAGQIVGAAHDANTNWHAFLYSADKMKDLNTVAGLANLAAANVTLLVGARSINASGQIVGTAYDNVDYNRGFLYNDGRVIELSNHGQPVGNALAINDNGDVVGVGFYYSHGDAQSLGGLVEGLGGEATALNNHGLVVGRADTRSGFTHAFLYHDGKMQDLNTLVGQAGLEAAGFKVLIEADGINDRGQIVGVGVTVEGKGIAFLLTPADGT